MKCSTVQGISYTRNSSLVLSLSTKVNAAAITRLPNLPKSVARTLQCQSPVTLLEDRPWYRAVIQNVPTEISISASGEKTTLSDSEIAHDISTWNPWITQLAKPPS